MATFIVDGDKGGVGKSFFARAMVDYLIQKGDCKKIVVVDCDPKTRDVVAPDAIQPETVDGIEIVAIFAPVSEQSDVYKAVSETIEFINGQADVHAVFSMPAGASVHFNEMTMPLFELLLPLIPIWMTGKDESSVVQLTEKVQKVALYEHGIVALNEIHGEKNRGTFAEWEKSATKKMLDGKWEEIVVPVLNSFVTQSIKTMPFWTAVRKASIINGGLSPTIRIGIETWRKICYPRLDAAIESVKRKKGGDNV